MALTCICCHTQCKQKQSKGAKPVNHQVICCDCNCIAAAQAEAAPCAALYAPRQNLNSNETIDLMVDAREEIDY
jgi:hypothetical protein